jgi:pimeloyl-ACP methyl ester carboxylesterase
MPFASAAGHQLEYEFVLPDRANAGTIVFLHEGLGSIALWRDFPQRLCEAVRRRGLVYSRYGYGKSDPLTDWKNAPRRVDFMHDEATHALPELLDRLQVERPVLLGHSDGGSIALLHTALTTRPVEALIVLAPHVLVEDVSITSIEAAKVTYETTDFRDKLARYHDDVDSAFRGWNDIWLNPEFRSWNIESVLPAIHRPILAIQGIDDEYGTMEQVDRLAAGAINTRVELVKLANCRHSPHRDQPDAVIRAVQRFLAVAPGSGTTEADSIRPESGR